MHSNEMLIKTEPVFNIHAVKHIVKHIEGWPFWMNNDCIIAGGDKDILGEGGQGHYSPVSN